MCDHDLGLLSATADRRRRRILSRRKIRLWAQRLWEGAEWELERRALARRPANAPPTAEQLRFLLLLRSGVRSSDELAEAFDFDDPKLLAAIFDADARGWVESRLGGFGGVYVHPPTWYEITSLGVGAAES
jgi:hypothetical protein